MKIKNYFLLCWLLITNIVYSNSLHFLNKPQKDKTFLNLSLAKKKSKDNGIEKKLLIGVTGGFNIWKDIMAVKYRNQVYSYSNQLITSSSPFYNFSLDYGILKNVSAGVALGYQEADITYKETVYTGSSYYAQTYEYKDKWTRYHFAARFDYHIIANLNTSLYAGVKFGYNDYQMNMDPSSPYTSYNIQRLKPTPYSIQAHMGYSYYFGEIVGINAEVGIGLGGPYIAAAGLAIKI